MTNDEQNHRSGFAILREILFPIIILFILVCFSKHIESTGNYLGFTICIVISIIVAFFCLYRLINIFLFPDKIYNRVADYSVPHWLINTACGLKNKITKNHCNILSSDSVKCSKTDIEQIYPSPQIMWDKYPDELKQALVKYWNNNNVGKALRLAAPVVFLINVGLLFQPNYKRLVAFFQEILKETIDSGQLADECQLLQDIIEDQSKYSKQTHKKKLEYYQIIEAELRKYL